MHFMFWAFTRLVQLPSKPNRIWVKNVKRHLIQLKNLVSRETLFSYPNFDKPFVAHKYASILQLGAVISQDDKPIAFYSRN